MLKIKINGLVFDESDRRCQISCRYRLNNSRSMLVVVKCFDERTGNQKAYFDVLVNESALTEKVITQIMRTGACFYTLMNEFN